MSMHDGHRQRLKDRFRTEGIDHFNELHVLELLLFYAIPRKDTNPIAHKLLDHFGSLSQVFEATEEELKKVEGIHEGAATFLTLISAVSRFYCINRAAEATILKSTNQCGAFLRPYFMSRRNERVYLLCLDSKCKLLSCKLINEGSVNAASISVRKVIETALAVNASSVVLAHNHPGGLAIPSDEDVQTTIRVARALLAVDVVLADHLVFADDEYTSMAVSRLYNPRDISLDY